MAAVISQGQVFFLLSILRINQNGNRCGKGKALTLLRLGDTKEASPVLCGIPERHCNFLTVGGHGIREALINHRVCFYKNFYALLRHGIP